MRRMVLGLACGALAVGPAMAADTTAPDPMAGFYGNTLIVTAPDGASRWQYHPDHTYTMVNDKGVGMTGIWGIVGKQICEGPSDQKPQCHLLPGPKQAGDTWKNGQVTFELKQGTE